jgi:hypothetical protein
VDWEGAAFVGGPEPGVANFAGSPRVYFGLWWLQNKRKLGEGEDSEETMWTLRGKLRSSIAVVILGGALLAAIGVIWLR